VILAGAGRAILLQLAHPAVGHGVARHSDFARDPMNRLHGTLMYVYTVMAGSADDQELAARYVNRKHAPVHGPQDPGERVPEYDARDPELQLWVAATLYDTAVQVHDRVLGHLPEASADELYRRYAALGTALQLPEGAWPEDRAAFARFWDRAVHDLAVDATVRAQSEALWEASEAPRWVRWSMPLNRFLTAGFLPESVRAQYEMGWTPQDERRFQLLWSGISRVYPWIPVRLRSWPERYYLTRLRKLAGPTL
jgi:uncharacterized protein (DUF2236 family)